MAALLLIASVIHMGRSNRFQSFDPRIVNGMPINADQYPWMVSLRAIVDAGDLGMFEGQFCGASLIDVSPIIILTAAHCLDGFRTNISDGTIRDSEGYINYLFADVNRTYPEFNNITNDTYWSFPIYVENMYLHPGWNATEQFQLYFGYDIALIILDDFNETQSGFDVKFEDELPTLLQSNNYDDNTQCCAANEELTAIGYGKTSTDGPGSQILRTTTLKYVTSADCAELETDDWVPILYVNDTFLVPGVTSVEELIIVLNEQLFTSINDGRTVCVLGNNTGICQGDSGGPLFRWNNGKPEIVGVTSYTAGGGCNTGFPDGYTNVASYYDWIMKVIEYVVDGVSYAPTMDPTMLPSSMPTTDPSSMPTMPSSMPSSMPTMDPTEAIVDEMMSSTMEMDTTEAIVDAAPGINFIYVYAVIMFFVYRMV